MNSATKNLIILNSIQDFGYKKLEVLLKRFDDDISGIFSLKPRVLNAIKGISPLLAGKILKSEDVFNIEEELELISKEKINIITIFDKEYPDNLKQISSPPIVLYIKGNLENLNKPAVAIVGSRNCTYYGRNMTRRICSSFAKLDIVVVSGMARGIDTAAHQETLDFGGKTIAVLGSGLGRMYPPENKKLSERIAQNGVLISEFPMNTPPLKENFPRRNRIISALSRGVVVIEAPEKSGALITADFALEEGKEVFAIPGNADSYSSKGTNELIRQGAKITSCAFDIVEELFPELIDRYSKEEGKDGKKKIATLDIPTGDKKVYEILSNKPIGIDSLAEKLNANARDVMLNLLHLEIAGLVKQLPGKLFVRV